MNVLKSTSDNKSFGGENIVLTIINMDITYNVQQIFSQSSKMLFTSISE